MGDQERFITEALKGNWTLCKLAKPGEKDEGFLPHGAQWGAAVLENEGPKLADTAPESHPGATADPSENIRSVRSSSQNPLLVSGSG